MRPPVPFQRLWLESFARLNRILRDLRAKGRPMAISSAPREAGPPLPEYVFTRTFDAPRELVFQLWTDPRHVAQWWGPHGFTNPVCEWDARPGGAIHIDMTAPDGTVHPMTGEFHEVTAPERIVFTAAALGEDGWPMLEAHNTVLFVEKHGKTTMTLRARVVRATDAAIPHLGGMEEGWLQSLERFSGHLAAAADSAAGRTSGRNGRDS